MPSDQTAAAALANFAGYSGWESSAPSQLTRLAATGFSGCMIWKVLNREEQFCLKCWPAENPPPQRLPWIHQILQRAASAGLSFLPRPVPCRAGGTMWQSAGCTWELMTWLPGEANYHAQPGERKLANAFRTLAMFHRVTRDLESQRSLRAPAIEERLARLQALHRGERNQIRATVNQQRIPEIDKLAARWAATRFDPPRDYVARLSTAFDHAAMLQPAIRDLWHDHVLFTGDEVTGFIDFGAMRMDTPLVDISRLLGSLARDDAEQRNQALAAYAEISPLTPAERDIVHLLDEVSTWIAGWNWLQWLYLERREFPSLVAVRDRLQELLSRQL